MELKSVSDLLLFIVFFIPGFVMLKTYSILYAQEKIDFSAAIFETIAFSCINYAICSPLLIINYNKAWIYTNLLAFIISAFIVILIIPIILVFTYRWFLTSRFGNKHIPITPNKSAWDEYFSRRQSNWIIVTLKTGKKIAGKYNLDSFASSYPMKDIYISELWKLSKDGKFDAKVDRTNGILILTDQIEFVEFLK